MGATGPPTIGLNVKSYVSSKFLISLEETYVKSVDSDENQSRYISPSEIIQQEINELALQREANKIKQKIRMEWSCALNTRKQSFWQQINNANDADQYEKWLGENTPILPTLRH